MCEPFKGKGKVKSRQLQSVSQYIFKAAYNRIILYMVDLNIKSFTWEKIIRALVKKSHDKSKEEIPGTSFFLLKPTTSRGHQSVKKKS